MCAGRDPFELVERGVAAAGRLSGGARPSREKEMSPSLDFFGWCTCAEPSHSGLIMHFSSHANHICCPARVAAGAVLMWHTVLGASMVEC